VPKYIFVTGGVVSSVGKGTVGASLGRILHSRGFSVDFVKIDPYVNVDAGTLNPYMHGEVFVTDDGGETDLDLGWYERFLDIKTTKENNITTGQVYSNVISRERRGDYLGQCVQIVPHVTDEIKRLIRAVGERGSDVVVVEVGGTAGDIEGLPFLEAVRQMRLEEGFDNTLFLHVALVPHLKATDEFKTKALQHSVNELRRIGIQPDIIVARSDSMIDKPARKKVALFGTLPEEAVFCSYDVDCVYEVPLMLEEQGMGGYVVERLRLQPTPARWDDWSRVVQLYRNATETVKIAVCGKYTKLTDSYVSVKEALQHSGVNIGGRVSIRWIDTEEIERNPESVGQLSEFDGVLVPGGFGKRGVEGKIECIKYARENDKPFLGICFGLQLSVVEFARHVCGLHDAASTEIDPDTPHPVIDMLPEQRTVGEKGGTMRLGSLPADLKPNTLAARLYGTDRVYGRHRHRYEVNPAYWSVLRENGLVFSGLSPDGRRVETLENPSRFFFFATQFHPEYLSRPNRPEPAYLGFVKAALDKKKGLKTFEPPVLVIQQ